MGLFSCFTFLWQLDWKEQQNNLFCVRGMYSEYVTVEEEMTQILFVKTRYLGKGMFVGYLGI